MSNQAENCPGVQSHTDFMLEGMFVGTIAEGLILSAGSIPEEIKVALVAESI